jgi:hypothetical protein
MDARVPVAPRDVWTESIRLRAEVCLELHGGIKAREVITMLL